MQRGLNEKLLDAFNRFSFHTMVSIMDMNRLEQEAKKVEMEAEAKKAAAAKKFKSESKTTTETEALLDDDDDDDCLILMSDVMIEELLEDKDD